MQVQYVQMETFISNQIFVLTIVICVYSYSICQHTACFMQTVTCFSVCMHYVHILVTWTYKIHGQIISLRSAK